MNELMNITEKDGRQLVYARELYLGLGLDKSQWSRWSKKNIVNNDFFNENIDWAGVRHDVEGNEVQDYLITLEFGKHIAMMARTEKSHEYRNYFIQIEKQMNQLHHISETALTNNIMSDIIPMLNNEIQKMTNKMDDRLEIYEENYRPTHANKMNINRYIKSGLGSEQEPGEADLVKQRVLLMLDAENWQDVPYKKLISNMRLIDESIRTVASFREKRQLNLFESYL